MNQAMMTPKNFKAYPKFRHNLWTSYEDDPKITYLTVSHGRFEVATKDADRFMRIRAHCTGHNTIEDIARRAAMDVAEVSELIAPLVQADILHLPVRAPDSIARETLLETLKNACRIWREQLLESSLVHDILAGKFSSRIVCGWLLETYHYVKTFPAALAKAAEAAEDGELKLLLERYAWEETGHEEFVLRTLEAIGFKRREVEESIPLVSTRLVSLLMKELFTLEPATVLLVAPLIESSEFTEEQAVEFQEKMNANYRFSPGTFAPFLEHIRIDDRLGHADLIKKTHLIRLRDQANLNDVVNKLHDLKHALDLQALEIKDYYGAEGNYVPRQFVDFFAI